MEGWIEWDSIQETFEPPSTRQNPWKKDLDGTGTKNRNMEWDAEPNVGHECTLLAEEGEHESHRQGGTLPLAGTEQRSDGTRESSKKGTVGYVIPEGDDGEIDPLPKESRKNGGREAFRNVPTCEALHVAISCIHPHPRKSMDSTLPRSSYADREGDV